MDAVVIKAVRGDPEQAMDEQLDESHMGLLLFKYRS
jgi:hypothetical protein